MNSLKSGKKIKNEKDANSVHNDMKLEFLK